MRIIGLMPVRNEDWILGLSARAALMWCDELVILDHASTDNSREIITDLAAHYPVKMLTEADPQWDEMRHRERLLNEARSLEATHIAMIDADEVLTGNLINRVRDLIGWTVAGKVLQLPWLAVPPPSAGARVSYITSGVWGPGQQVSMAFKDQPEAHWSSASRDGYDFHHRNPMGLPKGAFFAPLSPRLGGIMHFQFASRRRLRAKQALYQATELLRWPAPRVLNGKLVQTEGALKMELAKMYGRAVYESEGCEIEDVLPAWLDPYNDFLKHCILRESEEPWQEVELKRLVEQHGSEKFRGLDFFGVC
jgi:Glycosyl transferase family 2